MVEQQPFKLLVLGSNPSRPTFLVIAIGILSRFHTSNHLLEYQYMQVNKDKVITLPKSVKSEGYEFVCPCPICTDKAHNEELKFINLQEVKNTIEDIIDSTSLYRKDFHIDISYTIDNNQKKLNDTELIERIPEIEKIAGFTKSLYTFTEQFNKNYRHPLMCELRENTRIVAAQIGVYTSSYDGQDITNQRLWDFQSLLSVSNGITEILTDIHKEEIFESTRIATFLKKLKETRDNSKRQLKSMFIQGLHSQGVHPHAQQQDFALEYGY